jgi:hypothetical protein
MKLYLVTLWIVTTTLLIWADSELSGRIQDMTLVAENNPYVITDNLIVPAGQKLVVSSGCVLLFKPFTGITVEGDLEVQGTVEKPIVFTSENDTRFNPASSQFPNPFDWNGIVINKDAGKIQFSNFSIKYSVYGLKSYKEDIVIVDGVFQSNGQSNLTVFETMRNVPDGIPYSYRLEPSPGTTTRLSNGLDDDNTQLKQTEVKKEEKRGSIYKAGAYGCAGAGLVCLGMTAYFVSKVISNQKHYLSSTTNPDFKFYKAKRNSNIAYASACAVPTLLFAGGSVLFFNKNNNNEKNEQQVTLVPFAGVYSGVVLAVKF